MNMKDVFFISGMLFALSSFNTMAEDMMAEDSFEKVDQKDDTFKEVDEPQITNTSQIDKKIFPATMCNWKPYQEDSRLEDHNNGSLIYPDFWPDTEYAGCPIVRDTPSHDPFEVFIYLYDGSESQNFSCVVKSATIGGEVHDEITRESSGTGEQRLSFTELSVPIDGAITVYCHIPSGWSKLVSYGIVELHGPY